MEFQTLLDKEIVTIEQIPKKIVINIFMNLSFDMISKLRQTCKRFNVICIELLIQGFKKSTNQISEYQREIRQKLPRRESERRNHSLHRHCEVLTGIETRISLLNMALTKHKEAGVQVAVPGRLTDEILRVLGYLHTTELSERPHIVLKEVRDLSSMIIDHFVEIVLPPMIEKARAAFRQGFSQRYSVIGDHLSPSTSTSTPPFLSPGSQQNLGFYDVSSYERRLNALNQSCTELRANLRDLQQRNVSLESSVASQGVRLKRLENICSLDPQLRGNDGKGDHITSPNNPDDLTCGHHKMSKTSKQRADLYNLALKQSGKGAAVVKDDESTISLLPATKEMLLFASDPHSLEFEEPESTHVGGSGKEKNDFANTGFLHSFISTKKRGLSVTKEEGSEDDILPKKLKSQ